MPTLHTVPCEKHKKHNHSLCGQNVEYVNVNQVAHIITTLLQKAIKNLMAYIPLRTAQSRKNAKFSVTRKNVSGWKHRVFQLFTRSLPHSWERATFPYHKPDKSSTHPTPFNFFKLHFNIILSFMPRSTKWFIPSSVPTKTPYACLSLGEDLVVKRLWYWLRHIMFAQALGIISKLRFLAQEGGKPPYVVMR